MGAAPLPFTCFGDESPALLGRVKNLSLQALSEAGNERLLYDYQKAAVGTEIACLRADVQVMQKTDDSVPLERLAGVKTF